MSQQNTSKPDFIYDSGAFSAWTKKIQIDLDEYIRVAKQNLDIIDYVVSLDVIPGEYGQKGLPDSEIERSASLGWENCQKMIKAGIPKDRIIHVFHQGENFHWLEKMIQELSYIGLSPANDRTTHEKILWLDRCMDYVTDQGGYPIIKFHGFAVTSLRLIFRYPWYSVDSSTWIVIAANGAILIPVRHGEINYRHRPQVVGISDKYTVDKMEGRHLSTYGKKEQKFIENYILSKGIDIEAVKADYHIRAELNLIYFRDLMDQMEPWPTRAFDKKGLKSKRFDL